MEAEAPADRDNNTDALSKYIVLKGGYLSKNCQYVGGRIGLTFDVDLKSLKSIFRKEESEEEARSPRYRGRKFERVKATLSATLTGKIRTERKRHHGSKKQVDEAEGPDGQSTFGIVPGRTPKSVDFSELCKQWE